MTDTTKCNVWTKFFPTVFALQGPGLLGQAYIGEPPPGVLLKIFMST